MRLAKYLAHAGVASRRAAEAIVSEGRVSVDGETVRDPARDVGRASRVLVDGRAVEGPEERVVYAVHKPVGVLSTASDPHGRPTVLSLVPVQRRLYPVGRLDADSSGLILLTNDGGLAHRLTHPRYEVPKTYRVRLAGGPVSERALVALRAGVELEDGPSGPAEVRRVREGELEVTIREGRNRQVRRMCEAVGYRVLGLRRVRFGSLALGALAPGSHRRLSEAEIRDLRESGEGPRPGGEHRPPPGGAPAGREAPSADGSGLSARARL
ncbi:MAG TPA: pseudouridine synthase [Solirubrobacteraceae bacterium]|jgi:23S rRNA pseudouridine2605 synthase|nr:pseudouridine synthase [Solirubrobacteraceae bacterium]